MSKKNSKGSKKVKVAKDVEVKEVARPDVFLKAHENIPPVNGKWEHAKGIKRPRVLLPAGTKLSTSYNGKEETVVVKSKEGKTFYEWDGNLYGSLSRIAGLITGHPTSGPNFFGLGWGNEKYRLGNVANPDLVKKISHPKREEKKEKKEKATV